MSDFAGRGDSSVQFDQDQREELREFAGNAANLIGRAGPREIELPAETYPALIAQGPILIRSISGSTYTTIPKKWDGDLGAYLASGPSPLTRTCGFSVAGDDCVFAHSLQVTAASPTAAVVARVGSILAVSPDLASPFTIAMDTLRERDLVEIKLDDVRVAFAQRTRSLELTSPGLIRTAPQLKKEHEGELAPPPNWHAIRATLPAGTIGVQLVPHLQWLNVGGEYLIWLATIPNLIRSGAIKSEPVEGSAVDWHTLRSLRDAGSRLVLPRMVVGPAESRDRRLHRAVDNGHLWAANYTDRRRERVKQGREGQARGLGSVERRETGVHIVFGSERVTEKSETRSGLRIFVGLSMLRVYGPYALVAVVLVAVLWIVAGVLFGAPPPPNGK